MHQSDDAKRHVVLMQSCVFRSVAEYLEERGVDTTVYERQVAAVTNNILVYDDNNAPLQHVVGQNISRVHQSAAVQGSVDADAVRELLASFRSDVDRNAEVLQHAVLLRAMADTVDTTLSTPDAPAGTLGDIAQMLPGLVAGTVVQQGGEALAGSIGSLLG